MIRPLIAGLLSLLLFVQPVMALPVLLVKAPKSFAGSERDDAVNTAIYKACLNALGVYWDEVGAPALKTEWLRVGVIGMNDGTTKTYGGVVLEGADMQRCTTYPNGPAGIPIRPDSLLLMRTNASRGLTWPTVPGGIWWMGPTNSSEGGGMWLNNQPFAACTTGSGIAIGASFNNKQMTAHLGGKEPNYTLKNGEWRSSGANSFTPYNRVMVGDYAAPADTSGPGTLRTLVRLSSSNFVTPIADLSNTDFTSDQDKCYGCFGYQTGGVPLAMDTTVMWERDRDPASPPTGFFWPQAQGGIGYSVGLALMQIARMDSAAGGTLIGQTPGWKPIPIALLLDGLFASSSDATTATDFSSRGITCIPGGACDTSIVKGGVATIEAALTARDLMAPLTVSVNPDSAQTFLSRIGWVTGNSRANIKFCLATWVAVTAGSKAYNASRYHVADPFGALRGRSWLDADGVCADGDTTTDCLLSFSRARLDSIPAMKGRLVNAVVPGLWDYVPTGYTKSMMPNPDSMALALARAKISTVVFTPAEGIYPPGCSKCVDLNNNLAVAPATGIPGLNGGEFTLPVRFPLGTDNVVGSVRFVATRGAVREDVGHSQNLTHNYAEEFLAGLILPQGPWYISDLQNYYHTFHTHLSVFTIQASMLGCSHGSGGITRAPAMELATSLIGQVNAINSLAWKGRPLIKFVYLDEVNP